MDHVEKTIDILRATKEEFGEQAFMTSSFGIRSAALLHLVSKHWPLLRIVFIDTGFHFAETLHYREKLVREFGLNSAMIPFTSERDIQTVRETELWRTESLKCCKRLKVLPLEKALKTGMKCWISGVLKDTEARKGMMDRQPGPHGTTRIHPMLDWGEVDILEYMDEHKLPEHPLAARGYDSVGCWPCSEPGAFRAGRWPGEDREGCGIHDLTEKPPCEE